MKKVVIGKKEWELISSIDEIRYDKMVMFNQYVLAIFEGIDTPLFALTMDKINFYYNKGDYIQAYNEFKNYETSVKFKEYSLDPMGMCFALLVKGDEADEDTLKGILQEMIDEGLKWEMVKTEVLGFMKLSPEKFSPYLQAWEMMARGIE